MRSVCFFHFILGHIHETLSRVLLGRKKSNLGQTPKFYPQMYILQTRRQVSWGKKKISQISLSYSSLKRSCSTDKSLQKHNTFIFCFSKVIEVYKLLKSEGSTSFSVNENTKKCICYINNMFSKIFINQAFKSYTSFHFIYTY